VGTVVRYLAVTNPDEDSYSFPSTSQEVNLSVGQKQPGVNFAEYLTMAMQKSLQLHAPYVFSVKGGWIAS